MSGGDGHVVGRLRGQDNLVAVAASFGNGQLRWRDRHPGRIVIGQAQGKRRTVQVAICAGDESYLLLALGNRVVDDAQLRFTRGCPSFNGQRGYGIVGSAGSLTGMSQGNRQVLRRLGSAGNGGGDGCRPVRLRNTGPITREGNPWQRRRLVVVTDVHGHAGHGHAGTTLIGTGCRVVDGCPAVGSVVILTSLNRYSLGNIPVSACESEGGLVRRQAGIACQVERDVDARLRACGQCHIVISIIALSFVDGETGGVNGCCAAVGIVVGNVDRDANGRAAVGRGWGIGNPGPPRCRTRLLRRKYLNGLIPVPVGRVEGEGGFTYLHPRVSSGFDFYRDGDGSARPRFQPDVVALSSSSFSNVECVG